MWNADNPSDGLTPLGFGDVQLRARNIYLEAPRCELARTAASVFLLSARAEARIFHADERSYKSAKIKIKVL